MEDILKGVLVAIGVLVLVAFILGWPLMWLWNNCLIGAVDGVHEIGFWQAVGLNFLAGILFKNSSSKKD